nr:MDR family MFS transporter [Fictibacillus gelatini]
MKSNRKVVMIALMMATFLTAIEGTIVSTAMPKIVSDLKGIELMNWVFSIFLLISATAVPIFGKLSDLFGRKSIFIVGTLIFLLGSTLCGFSQSMQQLIWFRALQGVGAGAILPVTSTIIGDIFPVEQRAKMMGFMGMIWGIAGITGPLVGGFFVDQISWHWIFFMNIPFGIVAIIMIAVSLKESIEKKKHHIDYLGAITFAISMISLLYALQKGGEEHKWTTPTMLGLFASFIAFLLIFLWIESKVKEPMMPLELFRSKVMAVSNAAAFLVSSVLIGLMVYIPMWVQGVLGQGATRAGFASTPMSLTWMLGSFLCGRMLVKNGQRAVGLLGTFVIIAGTVCLSFFQKDSMEFWFYPITALIGLGFGLVITLFTVSSQAAVDWSKRGVATASNTFFRTLGQTIGAALFGTYFNATLSNEIARHPDLTMGQMNQLINPEGTNALPAKIEAVLREILVSGLHHIFLVLIIIAVIAMLISANLPRETLESKKEKQHTA